MAATYCLHGYDWDPVATRMAEVADADDDSFLYVVAEGIQGMCLTHAPDGPGCFDCRGVAVELCTQWAEAQRVMLAWLLRRAGQ